MKISAKGRYALATLIYLAGKEQGFTTAVEVSEKLGISKLYLEQVFAILKKSGFVSSVKGSAGGYQMLGEPADICALDVLRATELTLFEQAEAALPEETSHINRALAAHLWKPLDKSVEEALGAVTLRELVRSAYQEFYADGADMFYI
ncbi:MAG: Rrf2 family transcriptional regulator [Oscillospiraceae bacterium]